MAVIKIPSSNIYGIGDDNSLFVRNKISQAEISANDFTKQKGAITGSYGATYYIWSEENESEYPTFVAENSEFNTFEFSEVAISSTLFGVVASEEASLLIEKPIDISELEPNTNGYVSGFNIVRHQQWLVRETDMSTANYVTTASTTAKTVNLSRQMFYNRESNTLTFPLEEKEILGINATIVFDQQWFTPEPDENGFIGVREYFLLSETIQIEGLYYSAKEVLHKYGSGVGNDYVSLPTNEIMQEGCKLYDKKLSDQLLQSVVSKYSRGKEVYELKCSLTNYYDEYGLLAICPTQLDYPATFKKYDIVEPYIYTSTGEIPLSEKTDSTPKQFIIIGIDFEYKGVVWQKITIQEYIE